MSPGVDHIRERVNARDALVRRGRYVSLAFLLGVGDQEYVVTIEHGRVTSVEPRRLATSTGRFTIRAAKPGVGGVLEASAQARSPRSLVDAGRGNRKDRRRPDAADAEPP